MHLASLQDAAAQAWRNGGGITHELLAWPEPGHWLVRVSVATIARGGAFSAFEGVERWFSVLEGDGVRLDLPDGSVTLTPSSLPLSFAGEAAPMCTPIDSPAGGSTRDLNLMTRRGAGVARLAVAAPASTQAGPTRWRGLYAAQALTLEVSGVRHALAAGTLAWSSGDDASLWRRDASAAAAFWLTLTS